MKIKKPLLLIIQPKLTFLVISLFSSLSPFFFLK